MYLHNKEIVRSGVPVGDAAHAIIMLHGRGASASSIITLKDHLNLRDTAILAPQATNSSWYPFSFMAPVEKNQPTLDSALEIIHGLVKELKEQGIPGQEIYFLGFSQGACLALEYTARHAEPYGGVIAFTGGLIGEVLDRSNYQGDFGNTPVLISTKDPDPHVPLPRVEKTAGIFRSLNARVDLRVEKGGSHTIELEELKAANLMMFLGNGE
jgi:phospholipase/carboxylesterase